GRQRAILREGVYAINPALFVVITEHAVYRLRQLLDSQESESVQSWQEQLAEIDGFSPTVVGAPMPSVDPIQPDRTVNVDSLGIVVRYHGRVGRDLSGDAFRHGERVAEGERGVWERPLGPGKYAFNTYAGNVILVPTTNFVLHWITGRSESHRYDESLRSIDLVTKDAYEPMLPLSVVVHIDYQKAPSVIQRFGDVKKLITQTRDPMLSAYFRD